MTLLVMGLGLLGLSAFAFWYVWERSHRKTMKMPAGVDLSRSVPHRQEFELYHNVLSLCARKVRICLAEYNIPYRSHHIDLIETGSYEVISRDYLAINPGGLVPTLIHNGHPVYESDFIINYIADKATRSNTRLTPTDPAKRAEMEVWIARASLIGEDASRDHQRSAGQCIPPMTVPLFVASIRYIPVAKILEGLLFHRLKDRAAFFLIFKLIGLSGVVQVTRFRQIIQSARDAMVGHLRALEDQLALTSGDWILGADFSLADVSWMSLLHRLEETWWLKHILANHGLPRVSAYWTRLKGRESYRSQITALPHPIIDRGIADLNAAITRIPGWRALYEGS
ncbi:glutathione S-transferase family protein [Phenylobacterium sp.]|uniref:glutathione S-transferase family protein n=1 Tax=Phenylobacterium sp. TaxID=1871053 RepID=UPI0025CE9BE0|nr:glutathione S-transferase family protein [Phenylobacterium sp.]MCA3741949.1 glutathione S-transferase family protein [Phenylobacterium sp.]